MKRFGKDCRYWLWCVIVALGVTSCSGNDEPGGTGNNTPTYPVTTDTTSVLVQRILSRTDLVTKVTRVTTEERFPGLVLSEIAPGVDLEQDILAKMPMRPIIPENLKTMDERIFRDEPMGLGK